MHRRQLPADGGEGAVRVRREGEPRGGVLGAAGQRRGHGRSPGADVHLVDGEGVQAARRGAEDLRGEGRAARVGRVLDVLAHLLDVSVDDGLQEVRRHGLRADGCGEQARQAEDQRCEEQHDGRSSDQTAPAPGQPAPGGGPVRSTVPSLLLPHLAALPRCGVRCGGGSRCRGRSSLRGGRRRRGVGVLAPAELQRMSLTSIPASTAASALAAARRAVASSRPHSALPRRIPGTTSRAGSTPGWPRPRSTAPRDSPSRVPGRRSSRPWRPA